VDVAEEAVREGDPGSLGVMSVIRIETPSGKLLNIKDR